MSVQLVHEPEFPKLWMILEDNIKTKKYKQIRHYYADDDSRCLYGLLLDYCGVKWTFDDNESEQIKQALEILRKKYKFRYTSSDKTEYLDVYSKITDNNKLVQELRTIYQETGRLKYVIILALNENIFTFEQFRDLFKELDV